MTGVQTCALPIFQDLSTCRDTSNVLTRKILRQGVSIGIPAGVHGEHEICTWIGISIRINGGFRVRLGVGIPIAGY